MRNAGRKLPRRGAGIVKVRHGHYAFEPAVETLAPGRYTRVEQRSYAAFADFIGRLERCTRCIVLGGSRLGGGHAGHHWALRSTG